MKPLHHQLPRFSRRDFLRLSLATGGSLILSSLLEACGNRADRTPEPAVLPVDLQSLQGLDIDTFFQESYRRWLLRDPEAITVNGLAKLYQMKEDQLTDISDTFIRQTQALESGILDILKSYDPSALTADQILTADIYAWFLDDLMRGHPFMYDDYPINPIITSVHFNLNALFTLYHPLNNQQDGENYIARLSQVGAKIDQLLEGLKMREDRGVILPAFMIPIVLSDITPIALGSSSSNPFYISMQDRMTGITDDEKQSLLTQAKDHIDAVVIPAYKKLDDFLNDQQMIASNAVGVWQFDDGAEYYEQCLRKQTTTDATVDEIHDLGKQHVDRIQSEMREVFAKLGYPADESIAQLMNRLTADAGVYRGQEAVRAYEDAIQQAETIIPQAFSDLPRAKVTVIGGENGDYYMPASFDGSRPGAFFARTTGSTPKFGVKSLAYHEAIPGHHLQIAISQEIPNLPDLRRGMQFNAYVEGWALYAERLMWELGVYDDDPQGDLGRLRMEVFRAARLVVDTGIHAKRWSFDQAVDYFVNAAGYPIQYAQGEITRYSVWPAQATSYYVGFLKILELRQKAKDSLGDRFDLKAFHHAVLKSGSVPLSILERIVNQYIQSA